MSGKNSHSTWAKARSECLLCNHPTISLAPPSERPESAHPRHWRPRPVGPLFDAERPLVVAVSAGRSCPEADLHREHSIQGAKVRKVSNPAVPSRSRGWQYRVERRHSKFARPVMPCFDGGECHGETAAVVIAPRLIASRTPDRCSSRSSGLRQGGFLGATSEVIARVACGRLDRVLASA
jgi:hypothetical protein